MNAENSWDASYPEYVADSKLEKSKRSRPTPGSEAGVGEGVLRAVRIALRVEREMNAIGEDGLFERPIEGLLETLGMVRLATEVVGHGGELGHRGRPCPAL